MDNKMMDKLWIIFVVGVFAGIALMLIAKVVTGDVADILTRVGGILELICIPFMTYFTMKKGQRK